MDGASAMRIHYYRLKVRTVFRALTERISGVSARKFEDGTGPAPVVPGRSQPPATEPATPPGRQPRSRSRTGFASRIRSGLLLAFLFGYQLAMSIEMRLRALFVSREYLIVDRSYIDDLVSILGSFRLETPGRLVRLSAWLFPQWRIIYVSAGPEVEFARIVDVDLSESVHFEKSGRYEEMVAILESAGAPIRRVDSSRPFEDPSEDSTKEWE